MASPNKRVPTIDKSAKSARNGFSYQDRVASAFVIRLLKDSTLHSVACEAEDDIVLTWKFEDGTIIAEYVQVKSNDQKRFWSLPMLCEQESLSIGRSKRRKYRAGTSILEKSASKGDGKSLFRLVTRIGPNEDLSILENDRNGRSDKDVEKLAGLILKKLKGRILIDHHCVVAWVKGVIWDACGSTSAIDDASSRELADQIENICGRVLGIVTVRSIYQKLVEGVAQVAIGGSPFENVPHIVKADEILSWLHNEVRKTSMPSTYKLIDQLKRMRLESEARCESLWLSIGVDESKANSLAKDVEVGARREFFRALQRRFNWVIGDFGAGKSLAAERYFQSLVDNALLEGCKAIPIFLRAIEIQGAVEDAVHKVLKRIVDDNTENFTLIVDGVDEVGPVRAQELLLQSFELHRIFQESKVIVVSAPLPLDDLFNVYIERVPRIGWEESLLILEQFASPNLYPYVAMQALGEDAGLPLFVILYALHADHANGVHENKVELLESIVGKAISRRSKSSELSIDRLCRLGAESMELGGAPVPFRKCNLSLIEIDSLCGTRLVARYQDTIYFPVTTIRHWFAAECLRRDPAMLDSLACDRLRARKWHRPIVMWLARADWEMAARLLKPLVSLMPGLASYVVREAFENGTNKTRNQAIDVENTRRIVKECLNCWINGLGHVATEFDIVRKGSKEVIPFEVVETENYIEVSWINEPYLKQLKLFGISVENNVGTKISRFRRDSGSAGMWYETLLVVARELGDVVGRWESSPSELAEGFLRENIWAMLVAVVHSCVPWMISKSSGLV